MFFSRIIRRSGDRGSSAGRGGASMHLRVRRRRVHILMMMMMIVACRQIRRCATSSRRRRAVIEITTARVDAIVEEIPACYVTLRRSGRQRGNHARGGGRRVGIARRIIRKLGIGIMAAVQKSFIGRRRLGHVSITRAVRGIFTQITARHEHKIILKV